MKLFPLLIKKGRYKPASKKVQVIIERSRCIGCGSCSALCPNDFELDEGGRSTLKFHPCAIESELCEGEVFSAECVKEAIDACPAQCIKIA